jgi:hypothetical protein
LNFSVGSLSGYSLLAIGLVSLLDASAVSAGTLVEFPNLPGQTPEDLNGYLARPDTGLAAELSSPSNGGGPFPAVVVLHGCIGITGHFTGIADRLSSWGYVALPSTASAASNATTGLNELAKVLRGDRVTEAIPVVAIQVQGLAQDPYVIHIPSNRMERGWLDNAT